MHSEFADYYVCQYSLPKLKSHFYGAALFHYTWQLPVFSWTSKAHRFKRFYSTNVMTLQNSFCACVEFLYFGSRNMAPILLLLDTPSVL